MAVLRGTTHATRRAHASSPRNVQLGSIAIPNERGGRLSREGGSYKVKACEIGLSSLCLMVPNNTQFLMGSSQGSDCSKSKNGDFWAKPGGSHRY